MALSLVRRGARDVARGRAASVTDKGDAVTLICFEAAGLHARELRAGEVPQLQALFDANPEYSLAVNGRLPRADEAQVEFDEMPPPHLSFSRRWLLGLFSADGVLAGVAIVVADLPAPGVWHIGLYLLATRLRGAGVGHAVYAALEHWVRGQGAQWMRLGVVVGNDVAERFWARQRYTEVRQREGVDTGGRINTVRVMVKPLGQCGLDGLDRYLALVPRDAPGSALP